MFRSQKAHCCGVLGVLALTAILSSQAIPKLTSLQINDKVVGKGKPVNVGDLVFMIYKGTLNNGIIFDSNVDPAKAPYAFRIGAVPLDVIPGWDLGIRGMKVGGTRELKVPAKLAYGDRANGEIPANSDLNFELKLVDVVRKGEEGVYDSVDIKLGKGAAAKKGDRLTVDYTTKLSNGKLVDSTYVKKKPVEFTLGAGEALDGVDAGLIGMKAGGKRKIKLPPALAFGASGTTSIPPNSILIFEIELRKIAPGK